MYKKYIFTPVCALSLLPSLLFPVAANPVTTATPINAAKAITISGNDPVVSSLSFDVTGNPTYGTLSTIGQLTSTTAQITYTPNTDFTGTDSFTYTAFNGTEYSTNATVTVVVSNQQPVVKSITSRTLTRTPIVVSLYGSDSAENSLTFSTTSSPANGTLSAVTQVPPDAAQVVYTPTGDWKGSDTFTYKANNGTTDSSLETVTVIVYPI